MGEIVVPAPQGCFRIKCDNIWKALSTVPAA